MQSSIDKIINLLQDGKWHTIKELSQKSRVHDFKIEMLTDFLADYSFVKLDKKEGKAKLSESFAEFLKKAQKLRSSTLT